jgi:Flp pilus assembly protein protease CpaA
MGFGDVTLMAMIGALLGWQAALMVFFIAPFFGLALFVAQAIAARDSEIPYGPSLCLGALAVIVRWPLLWGAARDVFAVWWLVPATLVILLTLMAIMLGVWGAVKRRWMPAT